MITREEVEAALVGGGELKDHAVKIAMAVYSLAERYVLAQEKNAAAQERIADSLRSIAEDSEHRAEVELHGVT